MSDLKPPGGEAASAPGDIDRILIQVSRLADGVKSEFDLIAGRMTWLVIGESFIYSAFATSSASYSPDHRFAHSLLYLVWVLPFTGMLLAICVYMAILAAFSSINRLKDQRDRMIGRLPDYLQIDLIATSSRQQLWGNTPAHIIPLALFVTWAGMYLFLLF
jgi:hypothetical protein